MKSNLSKLLGSPYSLWALLALPSVGMLVGGMAYGELMHASGEFSARLMILALIVTPLRALFPDTGWTRWLLRRRRWIGVVAFGYAALHTLFYLTELGDWASIVGDGLNAGIWTGWIAFLIFVPLALTSNDWSVRWLGKRWKKSATTSLPMPPITSSASPEYRRADATEIQTQIDDATLVSPTIGRVLYRLAEPGEVLGSGGKVLTLVNLADVYMEIFLPSAQAHRVAIGAEARVKLDILDVAIPAAVSFVSPESQFTPKQVETPSEREKLMFRIKVRIPQQLVLNHIDRVMIGVRGVAYIRLAAQLGDDPSPWPEFLQQLPPDVEPAAVGSN